MKTSSGMFNYVNNIHNSSENLLSPYLASQIYLLDYKNSFDDALISINHAYDELPNHPTIKFAYSEIVNFCCDNNSIYNNILLDNNTISKEVRSVIIIFESGFIPQIKSIKIPFFVFSLKMKLMLSIFLLIMIIFQSKINSLYDV